MHVWGGSVRSNYRNLTSLMNCACQISGLTKVISEYIVRQCDDDDDDIKVLSRDGNN